MGYDETIAYLYGLQSHGIKLGLDNPRELLRRVGNPERAFQSIHIAGTNGKGSTAAMLSSMLSASGCKTGLFTSPHLVSFTERIRIDRQEISEAEVVTLADEIRSAAEGLEPTFFEVVTVMGFLYFQRNGVDWAVVETGMGGRLDATNTLEPGVSIITPVAADHREFLGETMSEIAHEKAGIIKPDTPLVLAPQEPDASEMILKIAAQRKTTVFMSGKDFSHAVVSKGPGTVAFNYRSEHLDLKELEVPLSGGFQASNAALALKALELAIPGILKNGEDTIRKGLRQTEWPGRMELVTDDPPTYVDGAHNPKAAETLAQMLREDFLADGRRMTLVLGVMRDKDVEGVVRPLVGLATHVIFAAPQYGRSAPASLLMDIARTLGVEAESAPSVAEAVKIARSRGDMVLATGSFYTIGEVKEALGSTGFLTRLREWQAAP